MMAARPLSEALQEAEVAAIREALDAAHGAVRTAAKALGVHPMTLHRKIDRLGLRAWLDATYPLSARQPKR